MKNQMPRRFIFNMVFVFAFALMGTAVAAEPMEKEDMIRFAKEFSAAAIEGKNDVASFFDVEFMKEVIGYCFGECTCNEESNVECGFDEEGDADQIKQLKQQLVEAFVSGEIIEYQNIGADARLTWKIIPFSCEMLNQSLCDELSSEDIITLNQKYEFHRCSVAGLSIEINETEIQMYGELRALVVGDRGNGLKVISSYDYDEADKLFNKSDERIILEGSNTEKASVQTFTKCDAKEVFNVELDEIGYELFARAFLDEAAVEKGETIETLIQEIKERRRKASKLTPDGMGVCRYFDKEIVPCREALSIYEEFSPNVLKTLADMELSECSVDRVTFYERNGDVISTKPFGINVIRTKKNNEWMVLDMYFSMGVPKPEIER